jgi:pyruvate dehydrogenase E2 component (dihydrolipoamide acetyltransferase)
MAISVVMPALEMAQETGKLISWLKKEGDAVSKGEPLLEIETDKAVMEIESPADGVLAGVKVQPGVEVPVGRTIAWIVRPGESAPIEDAPTESGRKTSSIASAAAAIPATPAANTSMKEARISPKARRLATERGIDLRLVRGSGPGGEILASDVLLAAESQRPESTLPSSRVARLMAERTTQSWTTVPHFFLVREVNAEALRNERRNLAPQVQQSRGVKLTVTDMLVSLVARTLRNHHRVNASWVANQVRENPAINISLAIAVDGGVVAPVIHNADRATLVDIAATRTELAERARAAKLRPADLSDGTFTISNLGMFGVDAFSAIITPPQAAILAIGRIADKVVAVDGQPAVRPMMTLTLSSDHRVMDGARAAEFLSDLSNSIANPHTLLS